MNNYILIYVYVTFICFNMLYLIIHVSVPYKFVYKGVCISKV